MPRLSLDPDEMSIPPLPHMHVNTGLTNPSQPDHSQRKVYPNLARTLKHDDIGKLMLRVLPFQYAPEVMDWSYVPKHDATESEILKKDARELVAIKGDDGTPLARRVTYAWKGNSKYFLGPCIEESTFGTDDRWCSMEEFFLFRKQNPEGYVLFKDTEQCMPRNRARGPQPLPETGAPHGPYHDLKDLMNLLKQTHKPRTAPVNPVKPTPPPENPGGIDYCYHPPLREPASTDAYNEPDLSSTDPYEILGLSPQEKDQSVIRKRYKILAMRYHPDRGGFEEIFKKISAAYRKLEISEFLPGVSLEADHSASSFETLFTEAKKCLNNWDQNISFSTCEIQAILSKIEKFHKALSAINLDACEEEWVKLQLLRQIDQAASFIDFYQIKLKLLTIPFPDTSLDVKTRISLMQAHLTTLEEINITSKHWSHESVELLQSVHYGILDQYAALSRSLIELLRYKEKNIEAFARQRSLTEKFIALRQRAFNSQLSKIVEQEAAADRPNPGTRPDSAPASENKPKTTSVASENTASAAEEEIANDALTCHRQPKDQTAPFTLRQETNNLRQNFEKNHSNLGINSRRDFSKIVIDVVIPTPATAHQPHVASTKTAAIFSDIYQRAHVSLSQEPCTYVKNTDAFGVQITELLVAGSDPKYHEHSPHIRKDIVAIAKHLGIQCSEYGFGFFPRDFFLLNLAGQIKGPMNIPPEKKTLFATALRRAISREDYASTLGPSRTMNRSLRSGLGYPAEVAPSVIETSKGFLSDSKDPYSPFYFEGGNIFTLANGKNEIKVLCGQPHLFMALHWLRLNQTPISQEDLDQKRNYLESLEPADLSTTIRKTAEEMYSQGLLKQGGHTGLINELEMTKEQLMRAVHTMGSKQRSLGEALFDLGYIKQFKWNPADLQSYKEPVIKYLCQKNQAEKLIADTMSVGVDDIVYLPLVGIHLDLFLRPAMKNALFIADFELSEQVCQAALKNADMLNLNEQDNSLLSRYILSAQNAHQALGPLLDQTKDALKRAGFTVVPMPGLFTYDSAPDEKSYNFNLMNAISGWSPVSAKYYYIVGGVEVGNLGPIFMDALNTFLHQYEPNLDLYFVGKDPDSMKFNDPMKIMNTVGKSYGNVHCLTFAKSTCAHQETIKK